MVRQPGRVRAWRLCAEGADVMQNTLTVSLTLKVRWWVKPMLVLLAVAVWLRIPFDEARVVKFLSRGMVPAVGDVLPRSPVSIPMPPVRPTLGKRPPLFDRSTYDAPDTDAA